MQDRDSITLIIFTPEKTLLERKVSMVELPGTMGRFMVLRNHEPLISSLEEGEITFESAGVREKVHVVSGFVEVNRNRVTVCAES